MTEAQIIEMMRSLEVAIKERDRLQETLTSVGAKQQAFAQQLVSLNQRINSLRQDLRKEL